MARIEYGAALAYSPAIRQRKWCGLYLAAAVRLNHNRLMPELPEVETVCRGLETALAGKRLSKVIQRRPDLRFPIPQGFADRLTGRRIEAIRRRAKYICISLDNGLVLLLHLGMSGRLMIRSGRPNVPPQAHDHLVFQADDGSVVIFNDARRFGMVDLIDGADIAAHPWLRGLGPEPLADSFNAATLQAALAGKRTPIKTALLDQRIVAGLGNIYVCEALYYAGISPRRSAHTIGARRAARLVPAIKKVLREAIAKGGSSLRDYVQTSGELGYFQHDFAVYGKAGEPCPSCPVNTAPAAGQISCNGVKRIVQSGRSSFYCTREQR